MRILFLAAALTAAAPAFAQASENTSQERADPDRVALGREVAEHLWPSGTYARMMKHTYDQMSGGSNGPRADLGISELFGVTPAGSHGQKDKSLLDHAREADPHFDERWKLTNQAIAAEMAQVLNEADPGMRERLAGLLAGKFTNGQLREMGDFFETPAGSAFASESMVLMASPEMVAEMRKTTPRIWAALAAAEPKIKAATAHLPPPPKRKQDSKVEERVAERP